MMLVAGGGGGASYPGSDRFGGGGGGGGLVKVDNIRLRKGNYSVAIGGGGKVTDQHSTVTGNQEPILHFQ